LPSHHPARASQVRYASAVGGTDYEQRDAIAAANFARFATVTGVERIGYLAIAPHPSIFVRVSPLESSWPMRDDR